MRHISGWTARPSDSGYHGTLLAPDLATVHVYRLEPDGSLSISDGRHVPNAVRVWLTARVTARLAA